MGYLVLCAITLIVCAAINIYDAKQYKEHKYYKSITKFNTDDKYDVKKTMEEIKNNNIETNTKTNDWQVIYKHGFSFNDMYEPNPYYNPNKKDSKKLKRTEEYNIWQKNMLCRMEQLKIKSLEAMNVDPNKPMKIEVEFTLVKGSDTDNPIKSFMDTLVEYYGLKDDNNFYIINASRDFSWAASKEYGKIKFRITNIDKNNKGQITEVKIIKEKIEAPKTIIKEVEVIRHVENKCSDFTEKELSRLTIENKRKEAKINELKKQLESASKTVVEIPKEVVKIVEVPKTVIKEVEVIKEVVKESETYKTLYNANKTLYDIQKRQLEELQKDNEKKNNEINKLKNQLKTASKETKESKMIIEEVVKEDNRYKMLYEKYKTAYETLKDEVDNRNAQMNYNTQSKIVKTDAYRQQLERIKQMKISY